MARWAAAMIALGVHAAFIAIVHTVGVAAAFGHRPFPAVADGIASGCATDAVLASSARWALCFAPWQSDVAACLDEAHRSARVDLASCDDDVAEVAVLDASAMERMRSIDPTQLLAAARDRDKPEPPPPDAPADAPPERRSPPPTNPSQVVETAKPDEEKEPDHARFVAEYDTRVAKQTVARGAVNEPMVANGKPSTLTPAQSPREASVGNRADNPASNTRQSVSGGGSGTSPKKGELAMRDSSAKAARMRGSAATDGYLPKAGQSAGASPGSGVSESVPGPRGAPGGPAAPNLKATADVLERAIGGGSVDHLEDVESGDTTALNAKRWVHASFFNRLKRQVAQNWDPASVWRRTDPRGQVYGGKTRITQVRVSLSRSGKLAKIVVITPSGVSELDDEALRAFRAAGPFPNPPPDLAGTDQLITFAFAFYFEIGSPRASWRVIRSM